MATGLFHRQTRDRRTAGDHAIPADTTAADVNAADTTVTTREPGGATVPVPPGGATVPPGGATVPPGGATAPPDTTRRIGTGLTPSVTERDRAETVSERERTDANETERTDAAETERVEPVRWARTSFTATLSLILGVCATLAALSGRLAPLAVAIGVVGLVFAALGLAAVARRHVTGHHVALLGLAFSIAGVVFGILAINKSLPWLDGGADQAARLRDWLDAHWSWLGRW